MVTPAECYQLTFGPWVYFFFFFFYSFFFLSLAPSFSLSLSLQIMERAPVKHGVLTLSYKWAGSTFSTACLFYQDTLQKKKKKHKKMELTVP